MSAKGNFITHAHIRNGKERRSSRGLRNAPVVVAPGPAFWRKAMSTNDTAELHRSAEIDESTDAELTDFDGRPEDCACEALGELPCWPCYREGFENQNSNSPDELSGPVGTGV